MASACGAGPASAPSGAPANPAAAPPSENASDDPAGDLFDAARRLFDANAPPEIQQQYAFPSRAEFDAFLQKLQAALDGDSFEDLASFEPEARAALAFLEAVPELSDEADWLRARLDDMEVAKEIDAGQKAAAAGPSRPPSPSTGTPRGPGSQRLPQALNPVRAGVPYLDTWIRRIRGRPPPSRAKEWMPEASRAFAREGIPPQLAWIAEAESSFNPEARNPSGARGLFQLRPATARELGLSTFLPDQRLDPERSAEAAARQLRGLRERLGSWPLALAAYNAGEGRVRRAMAARGASDFAGAAPALSIETRMYVPKVLALVDVRGGMPPESLPAPR